MASRLIARCTLRAPIDSVNDRTHMATAWSATNAGLNCCMKSLVKGFGMDPASSIDTACITE